MSIDAVKDPIAQRFLRRMNNDIRLLQRKSGQTNVNFAGTGISGGLRLGLPAARGSAADHAPEMFIEIDITNTFAGIYVTAPTDTSLTTWTWVYINGVTMT